MYNIARAIHSVLPNNQLSDVETAEHRLNRLVQAHMNGDNRMIDDFVLTGAAMPLGKGSIDPIEGYRVTPLKDNPSVFFIVAAISAEKIWNMLLAVIDLLGDGLQMVVLHVNTEDGKPVEYISGDMDLYEVKQILQEQRDFILNSGTVEVCFFNVGAQVELRLDACKHFQFHVVDLLPIIDLLHDFEILSKEGIQFF